MNTSFLLTTAGRLLAPAAVALLTLGTGCSTSRSAQPGTATATTGPNHKLQSKLLKRLTKMMEGNYSSAALAATDRTIEDRRLHIHRIWRNRDESADGIYFYVEEALASATTKPDRQQVWQVRLRPQDDKLETQFYTLRGAKRFVGQWKDKNALAGLTPDSLVVTAGCNILFYQNTSVTDGFRGATEARTCPTNQQGATYTITDLTFSPEQLIRWDRGFDGADRLVWGSAQGGVTFDKERGKPKPNAADPTTPTKGGVINN